LRSEEAFMRSFTIVLCGFLSSAAHGLQNDMRMQVGVLRDGRYDVRRATMLGLIETAYGLDADKVFGGPSWLDWDQFDVAAKAPSTTSPETVKLMLQTLLADRFKLVAH
jgi:uncharacterized protein (TIGR03435 family)